MCIPTMMAYAAPEHLARYVKPALHGEEIWCQLFSEPAAGSDVAGIRTRAERRRRRLGDQRPEGLDLGRALLRLRHRDHPHRPQRAQAHGPDHVLPVDEVAGRRGAADQADVGRRQLQRGVLHRRAHPRQPAARQGGRGLEGGADHADERAARGRPAVGRPRCRRADGAGARHRPRGRPGDPQPAGARQDRRLVRPAAGPEAHALPHADGAVQGPDTGARNRRSSRSWRRPRCRTWAPSPWS